MPNQILQVDENMLETKLDRLVSEKVEQLLNAMLDAEADEITGACRRSYTLECKTNAARRALCFVKLGSAFCAVFFRSVGSGFSAGCAVSAAACLRCVGYLVMRACSLR